MGSTKVFSVRKKKSPVLLRFRHFLFPKSFKISRNVRERFLFKGERRAFRFVPRKLIKSSSVSMFYPGCGIDVLRPLLWIRMIAPFAKEVKLVLVDTSIDSDIIRTLITDVTKSHGWKIKKLRKRCEELVFVFKEFRLVITCIRKNVLLGVPKELKKGYDVYFERAFELFRTQDQLFIQKSLKNLKKGGVVIVDSGLLPSEKKDLDRVDIDDAIKNLGFYDRLAVYKKK